MRFFWLEHRGSRHTLREGETIIGRGEECTLFIEDASVSRNHALVRRVGRHITITDLGSSNGTFVNGALIDGARSLEVGDSITLGSVALTIGGDAIEPSAIPPGIEIIEQRSERPQTQATTDPQLGAIIVLESLVSGHAQATNHDELVGMIRSSMDRLLSSLGRRSQPLGPDDAARLVAVAQAAASWFPDGRLNAWAEEVRQKLA